MPDLLVGLDGGGTKTRVECYDAADFQLLGAGEAGACNIAAMEIADALASAAAALGNAGIAPASVTAVCAAVAGYSHKERRFAFQAALSLLLPNARVRLAPDYEAAFRSALPGGSGVLVVAGTGSIAYARSSDGMSARAGGYGYLIDDAGSGYGVGRQALAAVLASQEGLGETTDISQYVAHLLGWTPAQMQRDHVVQEVYFGGLERAKIASLAKAVADAAAAGDTVAQRILMHAGGALARLADSACRRAFPAATQPIPVARVGSMWQAGASLTDVFERSLKRFAPLSVLVQPSGYEPAWGAAQLAAELLHLS